MEEVVRYRLWGTDSLSIAGLTMEILRFCGIREPAAMIPNLREFGLRLKNDLVRDGELSPAAAAMARWYGEHTQLDSESVVTVIVRIQAVSILALAAINGTHIGE